MMEIAVQIFSPLLQLEIFNQPLYYLSENIRQQLYKINADTIDKADNSAGNNVENNTYNASKLDTDLGEIILKSAFIPNTLSPFSPYI